MKTDKINRIKVSAGKDFGSDDSLLLVLRFRGVKPITSQIAKVLKELRLKEILSAVFVKKDEKTMEKLKIVEPYIIYGLISNLIKDTFGKTGGRASL